jgi:phospholipid transport system substrate-binding protein
MHDTVAGWKVFDVTIAGVSLVLNYRETFAAEVRSGGIDGLIKALADKNRLNAAQAAGILILGVSRTARAPSCMSRTTS